MNISVYFNVFCKKYLACIFSKRYKSRADENLNGFVMYYEEAGELSSEEIRFYSFITECRYAMTHFSPGHFFHHPQRSPRTCVAVDDEDIAIFWWLVVVQIERHSPFLEHVARSRWERSKRKEGRRERVRVRGKVVGGRKENEQRGTRVSGKFLTRSISGVDEATSNM